MTLDYCKTEYTVAIGYSISVSAVFIFLVTGSVLLFPNEYYMIFSLLQESPFYFSVLQESPPDFSLLSVPALR